MRRRTNEILVANLFPRKQCSCIEVYVKQTVTCTVFFIMGSAAGGGRQQTTLPSRRNERATNVGLVIRVQQASQSCHNVALIAPGAVPSLVVSSIDERSTVEKFLNANVVAPSDLVHSCAWRYEQETVPCGVKAQLAFLCAWQLFAGITRSGPPTGSLSHLSISRSCLSHSSFAHAAANLLSHSIWWRDGNVI